MRVIVGVSPSFVEDAVILHRDLDAAFRTVDGDDEPGAPTVADGGRTRLPDRPLQGFQIVSAHGALRLDLQPTADGTQGRRLRRECASRIHRAHPERSIWIPSAVTPASSNTRATLGFARWRITAEPSSRERCMWTNRRIPLLSMNETSAMSHARFPGQPLRDQTAAMSSS